MSKQYRDKYDQAFPNRAKHVPEYTGTVRYKWRHGRVVKTKELSDEPGWFINDVWTIPLSSIDPIPTVDIVREIAE